MGDEKKSGGRESSSTIYGKIFMFFLILSVIAILALGYYLFFFEKYCSDEVCYKTAFDKCKKAAFIKEDATASWLYRITGKSGDNCKVSVTLTKLKEGSIENERLQGKTMICVVNKDNSLTPEGDLTVCSGLLKEQMQEILLQKMHSYILKNVGEIDNELKTINS